MIPLEETLAFRAFAGLVIGLVLGSFATMASYRMPRGLSIVAPPSSCPACGHHLGVRDLVPVFSWLMQRGRCRYCGTSIPARYVWIELGVCALVMALFVGVGLCWALVPAVLVALTISIAVIIRIER